jgi:hypothetical protein
MGRQWLHALRADITALFVPARWLGMSDVVIVCELMLEHILSRRSSRGTCLGDQS